MSHDLHDERILILDFGSQYTQLIARRIRELNVYCEIHPYNRTIQFIKAFNPQGIILSGGPASVYDEVAPALDPALLSLNVPILGICYGMQALSFHLHGKVSRAAKREYGRATIRILGDNPLFFGIEPEIEVWMSHGDHIETLPEGFLTVATSANSPHAAIQHSTKPIFGVQFHPEVVHTPRGKDILRNFAFRICSCHGLWTMKSFLESTVSEIQSRVAEKHVMCGVSGGVDSTVTAVLIHQAIGDHLHCIFVNNGVLRKNEAEKVVDTFRNSFHINLVYVDASERFLKKLEGVVDPETKRKIIGNEFIYVFEEQAHALGSLDFLAQGTLYPDVIESISFKGPSATIKSHHNVGGLPEKMKMTLIEPLKELFKDEVREVGKELGIDDEMLFRQPFPGPGLAVRILGSVTEERLDILREADQIVLTEMKRSGWYGKVWQSFAVLLPVKTVGVMGDERTYENVIALRVVQSMDGMTANWVQLPYDLLGRISNRIINEVKGVNRVVYDISSKPPSTIEWE
ncbi:MAG TPA: glutamine-hydrolyzing GMP synthase [Thermodesulfobacteriota bacterium]|nr:glutamine-hydrolyzing GMP synthase [Thermodesulfobacteriota bacterium]HNU72325.1 glutamine-hydrolyzing GMP synthase [Thermodesulfobacteriota bacterium]